MDLAYITGAALGSTVLAVCAAGILLPILTMIGAIIDWPALRDQAPACAAGSGILVGVLNFGFAVANKLT